MRAYEYTDAYKVDNTNNINSNPVGEPKNDDIL